MGAIPASRVSRKPRPRDLHLWAIVTSGMARVFTTGSSWTQIVGKIRPTLAPWLNHSWQTPLYVTARGLGASPIPVSAEIFEIEFDFVPIGSMCEPAAAPKDSRR